MNKFQKYLGKIREIGDVPEGFDGPYPFKPGEDIERCLSEALEIEWYGEDTKRALKRLLDLEIDIVDMGCEDEDHPDYWDRDDNFKPRMTIFSVNGELFKGSYIDSSWGSGERIDFEEVKPVKLSTKTIEYWEVIDE